MHLSTREIPEAKAGWNGVYVSNELDISIKFETCFHSSPNDVCIATEGLRFRLFSYFIPLPGA